ncbi:MAG: Fic family protein [Nitrospinae bacterium]|nr:Fic family protein [Nitrospinota bacterium]
MRIPESPPDFALLSDRIGKESGAFAKLVPHFSPVDYKGRYLHWAELKRRTPPEGLSVEEWWFATKLSRSMTQKKLPFVDKRGTGFVFTLPDMVQRELEWLGHAGESVAVDLVDLRNPAQGRSIRLQALIDEAIYSSQIEGATTTRVVAKEMIRQKRRPVDKSERMILNNYDAMEYIRSRGDEPLTPEIVFTLHKTLTEGTLAIPDQAGRFRRPEEQVAVYWREGDLTPVHSPPPAAELPVRLERLCRFANEQDGIVFIHPLVKAIILHFMIGYDHPFVDGNGRTARALFYWQALRSGYSLIEFLSISGAIKKRKKEYSASYLHSETDGNDLTYFIIDQLEVIRLEIERLIDEVQYKAEQTRDAETILGQELGRRLNFRQKELLRHALRHPGYEYSFAAHAREYDISRNSARNDLLELSDELALLDKVKPGNSWVFVAPADLRPRFERYRGEGM